MKHNDSYGQCSSCMLDLPAFSQLHQLLNWQPNIIGLHPRPTINMESQQHFRFLDLPAELRNSVYHFVFLNKRVVINNSVSPYTPPAILVTYRQIYKEAIIAFYKAAIFYVVRDARLSWPSTIPPRFQEAITCMRTYDYQLNAETARSVMPGIRSYFNGMGATFKHGVIQGRLYSASDGEWHWIDELGHMGRVVQVRILENCDAYEVAVG